SDVCSSDLLTSFLSTRARTTPFPPRPRPVPPRPRSDDLIAVAVPLTALMASACVVPRPPDRNVCPEPSAPCRRAAVPCRWAVGGSRHEDQPPDRRGRRGRPRVRERVPGRGGWRYGRRLR